MATGKRRIILPFPRGGLHKAAAIDEQPEGTSASLLNVWPTDSSTGRLRGGIRPNLIGIGTPNGTPYAWCPVAYVSSGTKVGIALTTSAGTFSTLDGVTYSTRINNVAPGTLAYPKQASCAVYMGKIYQAASGTVPQQEDFAGSDGNLTASAGTLPTNCGLVVAHGDRLWLLADDDTPHVFYASKIGDATDWDTSDITAGGAFTSTGAEGGHIGEPIIAALSHDASALLIGTDPSGLYVVLGNPRTGQVRQLSRHVGPLMQSAWCQDAAGNTWLLHRTGLYTIPAGGGWEPQHMSPQLPNEFVDIDPASGDRVALGYDHRWPGIHIFINYASGTDKSYFYSLQTGGFFPQDFTAGMPVLAATFPGLMSANRSSILTFGATNYAAQFKRDEEGSENAESRNSYAWLGPIRLADPFGEGILHRVTAALAQDSGEVQWEVYVADTAEGALGGSASFTGARWSYSSSTNPDRYLNYWQHPRRRGNVAYIKISDYQNTRWLLEQIACEIIPAGGRLVL